MSNFIRPSTFNRQPPRCLANAHHAISSQMHGEHVQWSRNGADSGQAEAMHGELYNWPAGGCNLSRYVIKGSTQSGRRTLRPILQVTPTREMSFDKRNAANKTNSAVQMKDAAGHVKLRHQ